VQYSIYHTLICKPNTISFKRYVHSHSQ